MIKEREHVLARINQTMQTALSTVAFAGASAIINLGHYRELLVSREFSFYIFIVALTAWIGIDYSGLHRMSREDRYLELFFRYLKMTIINSGILHLASLYFGTAWLNIWVILCFAIFNFALLYLLKASFYRTMQIMRRRGYNTRQLLVVADGSSVDYISDLLHTKDWGYRIFAVVTNSRRVRQEFEDDLRLIAGDTRLEALLDEVVVDELIYAKSKLDYEDINRLMILCAERGIVFRLRPGIQERYGLKPNITMFNDKPLVVFRNIPENYLALKVKRGFDIMVALAALLMASPVLIAIAIAIKLDDGGPIFFHQQRVGLYGRRFACVKFRTMVTNAEALKASLMAQNEQDGPVFKMKHDPRITGVGRFLRKYSLDEFPQFLNVLNGDMSVVGPRPPLPDEVSQYRNQQNRRLSMKPGITCIWQTSGRNNIDFDNWVKLDTQYIDNWSLKLDLMIILKTVKVMIKGDGM